MWTCFRLCATLSTSQAQLLAFFEEDFTTRRFNLDEPAEGEKLFDKLRDKVGEILGPTKAFSLFWKDADATRIVCESDEDLKIAVEECPSASTGITEIGVKPEVLRLPTPPVRVTKVPPHRERRKCECEHCGKRFKCKSHLLDHIRIHTGERPYQCDVCGNSYRHRSSLRGHMNSHTGAKPHKCTFPGCTYESAWSSYMAEHMRQMHGKRTAESEEREFLRDNRPKRTDDEVKCHKKSKWKAVRTPDGLALMDTSQPEEKPDIKREEATVAEVFHPLSYMTVGIKPPTKSRAQRAQERNKRIETGVPMPLEPKPRKRQNKRKNTPIKREFIPSADTMDDAPLSTETGAEDADETAAIGEPAPLEDTAAMEASSPPEVTEDEDTLRAVGIRLVSSYVHAQ